MPAGQEPPGYDEIPRPGAVERGTMRRRLRRARRMRESLLTELGALVMEMHRQRRHDPALVERKVSEALFADQEAAGLARALRAEVTIGHVVAAGIAGGCPACGALVGTDDRFCARCGAPATARNGAAAVVPAAAASAPPPDPGTRATPAQVAAEPAMPPPAPGTRVVAPPDPAPRSALPPDPATRVVAPPEPGTRLFAPPATTPPVAAPPDPTTRVRSPDGDPTVEMTTSTTPK